MTNEEFIKRVSLEGEIWKDVVGYEGYYMCSSLGRIASLAREKWNGKGIVITKPRILSPRLNTGGYYQVYLSANKNAKQLHIHKIVAEAFIPNPNNYPQVDHINCDKLSNEVWNLRWCTQMMNNSNPISVARRNNAMHIVKEKLRISKSIEVIGINTNNSKDIITYPSQKSAKADGFTPSAISACCLGKAPYHKGYKWYFKSDYENLISMSKNS